MARCALLATWLVCLSAGPLDAETSTPANAAARITAPLQAHLARMASDETVVAWVHLRDKGPASKSQVPLEIVSSRCLARRAKVLPADRLVGAHDLPVFGGYVDALRKHVSRVRQRSRWFNMVSVEATAEELRQVAALPFVTQVDFVTRFRRVAPAPEPGPVPEPMPAPGAGQAPDKGPLPTIHTLSYGTSYSQLAQIGVPELHDLGYSGQGVLVGHFDNGHRLLSHEVFQSLDIVATRDFVSGDIDPAPNPSDPSYFGAHGINTLSALGGYHAGDLIGPAYGASYLLARTENDASETPLEEDNWLAAMEWADSLGVDVLSTSLIYLDFQDPYIGWTWEDMDGDTTVITRAADRAVSLGIVVVNAAGNEGLPGVGEGNTLGAPADGDSVLTVGSVTSLGERSSFSSVGPTVDGRIKPDVMARGTATWCASAYSETGYGYVSGTSAACPLVAGVVAQLLSARPTASPLLIRDALRETASQALAPDNLMGWGIIDAVAALAWLDTSPSEETVLAATRLLANVPNPFNPVTTLSFELDRPAHVQLRIFDVRGQLVRTLVDARLPAAFHQAVWDGVTAEGAAAASGTYFARLRARSDAASPVESIRKMTLVR